MNLDLASLTKAIENFSQTYEPTNASKSEAIANGEPKRNLLIDNELLAAPKNVFATPYAKKLANKP